MGKQMQMLCLIGRYSGPWRSVFLDFLQVSLRDAERTDDWFHLFGIRFGAADQFIDADFEKIRDRNDVIHIGVNVSFFIFADSLLADPNDFGQLFL
jgi:hypothetical protein